jgi:hypothetical protein
LNAFVERFIQSIRWECLDHFLVMGTKHLDYLCREFAEHYHAERPHQSLDNEPILPFPSLVESSGVPLSSIRCKKRLGGLLKSYSRKAAQLVAAGVQPRSMLRGHWLRGFSSVNSDVLWSSVLPISRRERVATTPLRLE